METMRIYKITVTQAQEKTIMTIKTMPVPSKQIKEMGWHGGIMAVMFHNGDIWHYEISKESYEYIRGAHSIGGAFAAVKKNLVGKKVN